VRLDRVERGEIKKFIGELRVRGLAKNTIRLAVTTLRALLTSAVEDRRIPLNPAEGLGRFMESEKAEEAMSLESDEIDRLLETAEDNLSQI
jgi:site-specific recombinase XerC